MALQQKKNQPTLALLSRIYCGLVVVILIIIVNNGVSSLYLCSQYHWYLLLFILYARC